VPFSPDLVSASRLGPSLRPATCLGFGSEFSEGIESLIVSRTCFTDDGLAALTGNDKLRALCLDKSKITDTGLAGLKGLPGLRTLSLRRTQITDRGLVVLREMPNLEFLRLGSVYDQDRGVITDAGLARLRELRQLGSLDLIPTGVGGSGPRRRSGG
jgi:hypothetical protein